MIHDRISAIIAVMALYLLVSGCGQLPNSMTYRPPLIDTQPSRSDILAVVKERAASDLKDLPLENLKAAPLTREPGTGYLICITGDYSADAKRKRSTSPSSFLVTLQEGKLRILTPDASQCAGANYVAL